MDCSFTSQASSTVAGVHSIGTGEPDPFVHATNAHTCACKNQFSEALGHAALIPVSAHVLGGDQDMLSSKSFMVSMNKFRWESLRRWVISGIFGAIEESNIGEADAIHAISTLKLFEPFIQKRGLEAIVLSLALNHSISDVSSSALIEGIRELKYEPSPQPALLQSILYLFVDTNQTAVAQLLAAEFSEELKGEGDMLLDYLLQKKHILLGLEKTGDVNSALEAAMEIPLEVEAALRLGFHEKFSIQEYTLELIINKLEQKEMMFSCDPYRFIETLGSISGDYHKTCLIESVIGIFARSKDVNNAIELIKLLKQDGLSSIPYPRTEACSGSWSSLVVFQFAANEEISPEDVLSIINSLNLDEETRDKRLAHHAHRIKAFNAAVALHLCNAISDQEWREYTISLVYAKGIARSSYYPTREERALAIYNSSMYE